MTGIHYQTGTKPIRKLKCNEKGTFVAVYSCFVIALKMHDRWTKDVSKEPSEYHICSL